MFQPAPIQNKNNMKLHKNLFTRKHPASKRVEIDLTRKPRFAQQLRQQPAVCRQVEQPAGFNWNRFFSDKGFNTFFRGAGVAELAGRFFELAMPLLATKDLAAGFLETDLSEAAGLFCIFSASTDPEGTDANEAEEGFFIRPFAAAAGFFNPVMRTFESERCSSSAGSVFP